MQSPSALQDTLISGVRRQPGRQVCTVLHRRRTLSVCNALLQSHRCKHKHADTSCRDFVMSTYRELKQANPKFPILVREAESAQAKLIARFGKIAHPKRHCRAAMHVILAAA